MMHGPTILEKARKAGVEAFVTNSIYMVRPSSLSIVLAIVITKNDCMIRIGVITSRDKIKGF